MLKAYLDPNIVNWVRRAGWTATELRKRLVARGLEPHFGIHGIYELARGLLSQKHKVDAQSNFLILSELDPVFVPTPEMLFAKELDLLRTGASVIPVLDELNRASARYQVCEMAKGRMEADGVKFVSQRQANIARDYPRYVAHQLGEIRAAVESGAKRPKTFDQVLAMVDVQVPAIIRRCLGNRVTFSEAAAMRARLEMFPALRSTVRANVCLRAIPWLNNAGASHDKTDDYRHVIEASYSHVFVTGDRKLAITVPFIQPNLDILMWDDIQIVRETGSKLKE